MSATPGLLTGRWPEGSAVVEYFGNAYEMCDVGRYDRQPYVEFDPVCVRCRGCTCRRLQESYGTLILVDANKIVNPQPITASFLRPLTPLARAMLRTLQ